MHPMHMPPPTVTQPHDGVSATSPTTVPLHAPTMDGNRPMILSKKIHVIMPAAAPVLVVANAWPARGPALPALPPSNPNQPNQLNDVPRTTNGMLALCVTMFLRGPRKIAPARAE